MPTALKQTSQKTNKPKTCVCIWKVLFNNSSTWQRAYQAVIFGKGKHSLGMMSSLQLCTALNATEHLLIQRKSHITARSTV